LKSFNIITIRSDNGGEFKNDLFLEFCNQNGIIHNFSIPRTPQQNEVVERKNKTIQECARTMLCDSNLPKHFWAEAVNMACYVLNRVLLRPILKKTSYELFNGCIPKISYFKVFGCKCFILNTKDNLDKFDAKSDEGIFIGYSSSSKAYRVYNKRSLVIEESLHVLFNETLSSIQDNVKNVDDSSDSDEPQVILESQPEVIQNNETPREFVEVRNHTHDLIIGDISDSVRTRSQLGLFTHVAFTSCIEPKNVKEACNDEFWIIAM
jgi:hypothetical protein